jgi:hypothetical protein
MTSYKISQLNPRSNLSSNNLIAIAEPNVSTKHTQLSSLWEACLNGSLNTDNTAIFKQNVNINESLNIKDYVGINTTVPNERLTVVGNISGTGTLQIGTINTGISDSVLVESSGLLQKRQINPIVWNTGVVFLTSDPSSSPTSPLTLVPTSSSAPIILGGGTNTTIISGSLTTTGNTVLGNNSSSITTINGTLSTTGNTILGNDPSDVTTINGTLRVNNLSAGNTNTVFTKNATSNALEIREINSGVWNTGVVFLTSDPSSSPTSPLTLVPTSSSAPIILGGGTNTTIISGSLTTTGNTTLGNDPSDVTTVNGTLSATGNIDTSGIILTSPDGLLRRRVTIDNSGNLITSPV